MQIVRIAWLLTLLIIAATFGSIPTARADLLISCGGCSSTVLGGTPITAAASLAPPAFLLSRNPNDNSGLPKLYGVTPVVLIPDNAPNGANLSFTELVRQGSTPIAFGKPPCDFACSFPGLGLAAEWASPGSDLLSYFGDFLAAGPSVAFDALIAATQAVDPGATVISSTSRSPPRLLLLPLETMRALSSAPFPPFQPAPFSRRSRPGWTRSLLPSCPMCPGTIPAAV